MTGIFDGKVAVVTGGGGGLGREYALAFAGDGAAVAVVDVDGAAAEAVAKEIAAGGGEAVGLAVDVSSPEQTRAMAQAAVDRLGGLHMLVNNAAIWRGYRMGTLLDTDPDYFDRVVAVNLKGALLCCQAAVPLMRTQRWGRIVNISSIAAWYPGSGVYALTKLAMHQLTYQVAAEVGDDGITCNAVAPGHIWNEATQGNLTDAGHDDSISRMFVKRAGTAADLYAAIRYFCSDEAGWVTGQVLSPNGGSFTRM